MLQFPRDDPFGVDEPFYTLDMMERYNAYLRTR